MHSCLAYAFSQLGNLTQTKHHVKLYDQTKAKLNDNLIEVKDEKKAEYDSAIQEAQNFILSLEKE